jgi:hypothetical protein
MRRLFLALLIVGLVLVGPAVDVATACPLCKEANETNPALPRAYMYSILFMLAVPATVLTGFGIGFYRLSKAAQNAQVDEMPAGGEETAQSSDADIERSQST